MWQAPEPLVGLQGKADLWLAEDAAALHAILLFVLPGFSAPNVPEPMALLRKHHETEPDTSAMTALLLVTDTRWIGSAGKLIEEIENSDILSETALDGFAHMFLEADEALPIDVVTLEDVGTGGDSEAAAPATVWRGVEEPLRRWAAARVVRKEPERWESLVVRAKELNARSAALIVAGIVDALESLEDDVQADVIDLAVQWPEGAVRKQALMLIAERDGIDRAAALGEEDPSMTVRKWARSILEAANAKEEGEPGQISLF